MAIAQNSRVQVLTVQEPSLGNTPATPTMALKPVVSSSLNHSKTLINSNALTGNRRKKFSRHGNTAVGGEIAVELSHGQFDDLIAGAMLSEWTTDVLRIGTTRKSFSVEVGSLDVAQYQLFKGVVPNTMSVDVAQDSIIGLSFGLIGKSQSTATSTAATTVTPALSNEPMVHKEGSISVDGVELGIVTAFSFQVDNGYQAAYAIGSGDAADIAYGQASVTGSMTVYFQDLVMYNRFANETQASVELVTEDPAGNKYIWLMNNVQFNTGTLPVGGAGPRTITMSFEALDDATHGPLEITREAA